MKKNKILIISAIVMILGLVTMVASASFVTGNFGGYNTLDMDLSENINKISIDVDDFITDIEIVKGDKFFVEYESAFKVSEKNNTLVIEDGEKSEFLAFRFNLLKQNDAYDIKITVPENIDLSDISIETDLGEITLEDISVNTLKIDTELSNFEAKNVNVLNGAEIKSELGKIDFSGTLHGKSFIETELGSTDIEILENESNYFVNKSVSLGKISQNGGNNPNASNIINVKTELGTVDINFK